MWKVLCRFCERLKRVLVSSVGKTCAVHANASEISKLGYEYVRICYLFEYLKYVEGLLINMSRFYIHVKFFDLGRNNIRSRGFGKSIITQLELLLVHQPQSGVTHSTTKIISRIQRAALIELMYEFVRDLPE